LYYGALRDIIAAQENAIEPRFLYAACVLLLLSGEASAAELFGKVVAIADGDTLTILANAHQQYKIRLSGIDAPERRQPYGDRAKQHLSSLVYGKEVVVVWNKRDRYGRIVGRVLASHCTVVQCHYTVDVGLEQIKAGFAWHYKQYEKQQAPEERVRYAVVEQQARARREGLWKDAEPVPPWQFRHSASPERVRLTAWTPSRAGMIGDVLLPR
jgi:endonuclease YncB( thermonuclease family)